MRFERQGPYQPIVKSLQRPLLWYQRDNYRGLGCSGGVMMNKWSNSRGRLLHALRSHQTLLRGHSERTQLTRRISYLLGNRRTLRSRRSRRSSSSIPQWRNTYWSSLWSRLITLTSLAGCSLWYATKPGQPIVRGTVWCSCSTALGVSRRSWSLALWIDCR